MGSILESRISENHIFFEKKTTSKFRTTIETIANIFFKRTFLADFFSKFSNLDMDFVEILKTYLKLRLIQFSEKIDLRLYRTQPTISVTNGDFIIFST